MARPAATAHLTIGEWAAIGALAGQPLHAFAIVKALAPRGELGRVWAVPTPVVYRAVHSLRDKGLIATVGEERSDAGPPRTLLKITPLGQNQLRAWLSTPVAHVRDVRGELMLKLAVLARLDESTVELVMTQKAAFEPMLVGLEREAQRDDLASFDAMLASWRLESARAVMRFLAGLAVAAGS